MMKLSIILAFTVASACARQQYETPDPHAWIPGGPDDCKSPNNPIIRLTY